MATYMYGYLHVHSCDLYVLNTCSVCVQPKGFAFKLIFNVYPYSRAAMNSKAIQLQSHDTVGKPILKKVLQTHVNIHTPVHTYMYMYIPTHTHIYMHNMYDVHVYNTTCH